jgi:Pilin accessory protein (PilO)
MSSIPGSGSAGAFGPGGGLDFASGDASGGSPNAVAKSCVIAGTRVIFELEWSPIQDRSAPEAEFQRARKLGYTFATMLPDKSLVGLARGLQPGPGRPHAAVVMLIERFSSGGAEAILLSAGNRVAFIGLMDRRPVPGFDRLVNGLEAALALLKEFRDIHIDQDVRVATDLRDVIPNGEMLQVQTIFDMPESGSLVRPLVNRTLRRTVVAGGLTALLVGSSLGYFLWEQHQTRKAAEEAARLAAENDPNRLYEKAIAHMLAQAGVPGNAVLDRWRTLLNRLPLSREGWALQRFQCSQNTRDCQATWSRNFGNFHDFLTEPPTDSRFPRVTPTPNNDLLGAAITTHHPWDEPELDGHAAASSSAAASAPPAARLATLSRRALPLADTVTQQWGSRLQDVALVAGNAQATSLKPSRLFGPSTVTDLQALKQPVIQLEWQVTDGLWSLPSIDLPPSAVPESLTVQLNASQITYTLTGRVYAKGKPY